jgi:ADP-ribosyl-[dinitrogen reductase] hydrolase
MSLRETQSCSRCGEQVRFNPRYPKYICTECASLEKKDENGFVVTFSNVSMSGGLTTTFWENGIVVKKDIDCISQICYINGEKFRATEARFGGVVIQKID